MKRICLKPSSLIIILILPNLPKFFDFESSQCGRSSKLNSQRKGENRAPFTKQTSSPFRVTSQPLPQGAFRSLVLRPEKSALGTRLVGGSFSFRLPHARAVYGELSCRLSILLHNWSCWEILCSAKYLSSSGYTSLLKISFK